MENKSQVLNLISHNSRIGYEDETCLNLFTMNWQIYIVLLHVYKEHGCFNLKTNND